MATNRTKALARRARWRAKNRAKIRDAQNSKNARMREIERRLNQTPDPQKRQLATVTIQQLRRPFLLYIDHHGNIHREDLRSAEALIEEWKEHHK